MGCCTEGVLVSYYLLVVLAWELVCCPAEGIKGNHMSDGHCVHQEANRYQSDRAQARRSSSCSTHVRFVSE